MKVKRNQVKEGRGRCAGEGQVCGREGKGLKGSEKQVSIFFFKFRMQRKGVRRS